MEPPQWVEAPEESIPLEEWELSASEEDWVWRPEPACAVGGIP